LIAGRRQGSLPLHDLLSHLDREFTFYHSPVFLPLASSLPSPFDMMVFIFIVSDLSCTQQSSLFSGISCLLKSEVTRRGNETSVGMWTTFQTPDLLPLSLSHPLSHEYRLTNWLPPANSFTRIQCSFAKFRNSFLREFTFLLLRRSFPLFFDFLLRDEHIIDLYGEGRSKKAFFKGG
jgi:hypothetical protein